MPASKVEVPASSVPGWTISHYGPKKRRVTGEVLKTHFIQKEDIPTYRSDYETHCDFQFEGNLGVPVLFCATSHPRSSHLSPPFHRWRWMIPKTYGESIHVKLGPFFFSKKRHERNFQPSSWFIEPTFKVASLKQPSKLLIQFQPTPQNLYIPKSKGWILTLQNLGGSNSSRSVWGPLHRSTPMSMTVTEREVLRAELQKCHAELAAVKTAKAALAVPWVGNKNPRKISRIYWKQANHHFFRENVLYLFFLMGFFFQGVLLSKF